MKFKKDDKVEIGELVMQPYLEKIGVTGEGTYGDYVGFRSRAPYQSVGGWVSRVGCTGEIYKRLELDDRFDDNWYEVYTKISLASYSWLNFHESELILISKAYPIDDWLKAIENEG